MRSIRTFLVIVLLSTICLVTFVAVMHGYRSSLNGAEELIKRQLVDLSKLVAVIEKTHNTSVLEHYSSEIWFQVWSTDKKLRFRSENAPDGDLITQDSPVDQSLHRVSYRNYSWRVIARTFDDASGGRIRVVVAEREDSYSALTEGIVLESVLPIIWVLPILGMLIWIIVGLGLKPLHRLAGLLGQRKSDEFTLLDREGYPSELLVLVDSTNELLSGLAEAFEREKRFTADAAHELRTPLAVLKVNLHNLAKNNHIDAKDYQALISSADRIGSSIEQLLSLYRTSALEYSSQLESVNVTKISRTVVADFYESCLAKDQKIELDAEPVNITSDPIGILTLLRNLVDNAVKYTPEQGSILITVRSLSENGNKVDGVLLQVEDSGPGISEENHKRVFDRFYRLGGDQHNSNIVGSGLGLSIVDHIVRLHSGSVDLSHSATLGGLCVTIKLPARERTTN
ncbi:ATP-binding protein [Pseudomaricurvus sp.]|uniref:ATP-binding protein n=1 Tax=Pseudomaricurvus sp. TaxID=2004510 RepID=UPI003F6C4076